MKEIAAIAVLTALPALALGDAPAATDATIVDGDVHRVIVDNEHVRVFDARAARGMKSPMHTHPPLVLVSIGQARFRLGRPDGTQAVFDLNPGQVLWSGQGTEHSWELLVGDLHAIGVEIKSAQGPGAPPAAATRDGGDSTIADPEAHHVLFENEHVRVFEGRTSHGRRSPMHSHPPSLLVSQDWIRLKLTLADGKTAIHDFHPGQVLWLPEGGRHSWEAIAGSGRVIAIEVKSARRAPHAD
ncbi:MAG TPA: hypothetical protein VFR29_09020 [Steroidobacteraceae bacterium]|nr:hypothetical protein [Steroidobacteraceae bacterium]